jgi:hypothetical protein
VTTVRCKLPYPMFAVVGQPWSEWIAEFQLVVETGFQEFFPNDPCFFGWVRLLWPLELRYGDIP